VAINFSGEFTTPRSPEEVFDFLADPNKFGPLLPDFQSMSLHDPTHFAVKVKVGVGNIRGSAEMKMELTEAVRPLRAQYKGQGSAVGSQVTVSASFDVVPLPNGTRVNWHGETSVFGKLASMAGGMLEPLGKKNIQKLIEGLQTALAPEVPAAVPEARPAAGQPSPAPVSHDVVVSASVVTSPSLSPGDANSQTSASAPDNVGVPEHTAVTPLEVADFGPTNLQPESSAPSAPAKEHHDDAQANN
jgi:carbon monoxide dehydrogenase subunit G